MLKIKTTLTLILVVATLVGAWFTNHYRNKFRNEREEKEQLVIYRSEQTKQLETYKNKYNREVTRSQAIQFERATITELVKNGDLEYLQQFDNLNKRLNNLEATMQSNTRTISRFSTGLADTVIIDHSDSSTFKARKFNYKSKYLTAQGLILADTLRMDSLVMEVPIATVVYWQRQHWKLFGNRRKWLPKLFGKKQYLSEITSDNPDVKITQHQFIGLRKR